MKPNNGPITDIFFKVPNFRGNAFCDYHLTTVFHPQSNTVTLGIYTCNNKKPRFVAKADAIKINKHTLRFTFTKRGLGRPGHYQFWGQTATDTDQGFVIADRLARHKNLVNHLHYR